MAELLLALCWLAEKKIIKNLDPDPGLSAKKKKGTKTILQILVRVKVHLLRLLKIPLYLFPGLALIFSTG